MLPTLKDAPAMLGPWLIGRRLGGGGMGEVFEATHRLLGRRAAIKILRRGDAQQVERFFTEARAAAAIRHQGIIDVYDIGVGPQNRPYIVMELLDGVDLALALIKRKRMAEAEVIDVAIQAAEALGAAHARGIVHRDLKPENIFLSPSRDRSRSADVKVLDFGVAKVADGGPTVTGQLLGTPQYMAPEQGLGRAVDCRADIYALGCILYEMSTGRPPFIGVGAEVIAKHHHARVAPPRDRGASISAELEELIMNMLSKSPAQRLASMGEVLRVLHRIRPDRRRRPRPRRSSRHGARYVLSRVAMGIAAGLAITALAGALFNAEAEPKQPDRSETVQIGQR